MYIPAQITAKNMHRLRKNEYDQTNTDARFPGKEEAKKEMTIQLNKL